MRIMASSLAIVAKAVLLIFRIPPSLPTASATGIPIVKSLKSVRYDATSQLRSRHTSRNRERIREIHPWLQIAPMLSRGQKECIMKKIFLIVVVLVLLIVGLTLLPGKVSSHREAPLISQDPMADNTDLYAFRSPELTDTVTINCKLHPVPLG